MQFIKSVFALGACAGVCLIGQDIPVPVPVAPPTAEMLLKLKAEGAAMTGNAGTFQFLAAEFEMATKVVKGAPYTALATTETTRTLADGNRIVNKTSSQLARDSAGRTRRDQTIQSVGPWASGKQETIVFINDPEAQVNYVLNPGSSIARKMPTGVTGPVADVMMTIKKQADEKAATVNMIYKAKAGGSEAVTESLGTKIVEGVLAEGKRYTNTIAAGQIGNERPIEISGETWTSPDLQMIVMSRHTDPQAGETIYRLTNIQRAEPDPSLFAIPSNYTVQEGEKMIRRTNR